MSGSNSSANRVLGLVISDLLWRRFMTEPEGDLTRRLTHLVRRDPLGAGRGVDRASTGFLRLSSSEMAAGAARNPRHPRGCLRGGNRRDLSRWRVLPRLSAFIERFWEPLIAEMERAAERSQDHLAGMGAGGAALPFAGLPADRDQRTRPRAALQPWQPAFSGFEEATATASSKRARRKPPPPAALLERLTVPNGRRMASQNAAQE